jgi:hypothetical protein
MLSKKEHSTGLPAEFRKYFWDVEMNASDYEKYPRFVAERILNYGDTRAIKWLTSNMKQSFIKSVVETSRKLNAKTKNYWKIMLE